MLKKIREYFSQKGQGVVEYTLLLGVVAILVIFFVENGGFVDTFHDTLRNIVSQFTTFNSAYGS